MSVDLPEPDGPMIAAKRPAGKSTRDAGERVHGGLALAVAAAEILAWTSVWEPFSRPGSPLGVQSRDARARCAVASGPEADRAEATSGSLGLASSARCTRRRPRSS